MSIFSESTDVGSGKFYYDFSYDGGITVRASEAEVTTDGRVRINMPGIVLQNEDEISTYIDMLNAMRHRVFTTQKMTLSQQVDMVIQSFSMTGGFENFEKAPQTFSD